MQVDEKAGWYRSEKRKRAQQGASDRRRFSDPKAFNEQAEISGDLVGEVEDNVAFDTWHDKRLLRDIELTLQDAAKKWREELQKPGALVMEAGGQQPLSAFGG
eukprot:3741780-Pyramimonas_sp.AAC.1